MKVLHCAHGFAPECAGGIESYVAVLLAEERARGLESLLLCGSHTPWPTPGIERLDPADHDGADVRRLHRDDLYFDLYAKAYHPGVERLFGELLDAERPDLIHVHQWIRLTSNLVEVAARRGIPALVTLHDLYTSCPRCFRVTREGEACDRLLSDASCHACAPAFGHEGEREITLAIELFHDQARAEIQQAARVVVADGATRDVIRASLDLPRERFDVLPLPYEPRFRGVPGAERGARVPAADEPLRFGYWGNVTYRKGAQVLTRAFRRAMQGASRTAELHLFGRVDTGALERELRATAEGLPVVFHGRYEYADLAAAGLHVAVFPMLCFETYGFVLDECYELGLPCIVTDNGAMANRAGAAALRVPRNDEWALASALRGFLDEPGRVTELAARIEPASLSAEEHLTRLLALYRAAVASGPREGEPVDPLRRAELLLLQREAAQGRMLPESGPS